MLGIYTLAEEVLTSQNWLCSTELVSWLVSYLVSQSVSQSVRPVSVFHVQTFCVHMTFTHIYYRIMESFFFFQISEN
jgi:hypothetical protein